MDERGEVNDDWMVNSVGFDQHHCSSNAAASPSEAAVARILNLSRRDTQGVVPVCLLIMNMTAVERVDKTSESQPVTSDQHESAQSKTYKNEVKEDKSLAKNAASFFKQDNTREK